MRIEQRVLWENVKEEDYTHLTVDDTMTLNE
jgi:hypothetical protein